MENLLKAAESFEKTSVEETPIYKKGCNMGLFCY